jgi:hypothetical protein
MGRECTSNVEMRNARRFSAEKIVRKLSNLGDLGLDGSKMELWS